MDTQHPPDPVRGINDDLDLLFDALKTLRIIAAQDERGHDAGLVYDFSVWWGTLMRGRWERIAHYEQAKRLTAGQRARFDQLRTSFAGVEDLLDDLQLTRPGDHC